MLVPRNARHRQRRPDLQERGADRVRPRLPRRHLRHVLARHQRRRRTARIAPPRPASSTCAISRMARRFTSSRSAPAPFPVLKDLIVDRSAFDRIQQAGGFITARAGSAPDGNAVPMPKQNADLAMDAAACIGCGACVAACPNASRHALCRRESLALRPAAPGPARARPARPRDGAHRWTRKASAIARNHYECEAVCPAEIKSTFIAKLNREYAVATAKDAVV